MAKIAIEIGNKIELEHKKSVVGHTLVDTKYASQLLDFDGIRTAKILMPIVENRVIPLEVGDEYRLCFYAYTGLYQCMGVIRDRFLDNKIYVVVVEFITPIKKFQRRKYFRLDCMFPIRQREVVEQEIVLWKRMLKNDFINATERAQVQNELDEIPKEWHDATASDISGGGIRFHSTCKWKRNALLELVVPLAVNGGMIPYRLKLRVIACIPYGESKIEFETRGEFIAMDDTVRENVIKYVFEEQRRRIRKD